MTLVEEGYGTPAQRSFQYIWDWDQFRTTLPSKTDLDNGLTTSYTYDNAGRQTGVFEHTGGTYIRSTVTDYDDANRRVTVTSDLRTFGDGKLQTVTSYDQLGRVRLVQKSEGVAIASENDGIKTQTTDTYFTGGRRVITSSPYRNPDRSDPTLEWTCAQHDLLGRVTAVATFKGNSAPTDCESTVNRTGVTRTAYGVPDEDNVLWTVVTDPAGKVVKRRSDSLGRLVSVVEDPGPSPHLNYVTGYTYDPLDNLTQVTQGLQTRSFVYSSLGRLLSATNPESGIIRYTYHDSGDLWTRTDARGKVTTTAYDSLHRVTTKSYSSIHSPYTDSTPPVTYEYHLAGTSSSPNIGQLKSVTSSAAWSSYSYDALGNITASDHGITGYAGNLMFDYDWYLNGGLKWIQYPSGRVVNYDVDDAGRTNKLYVLGSPAYADLTTAVGITNGYTPDGRIAQMKLGSLYDTRDYRTPGTPTVYRLGTTLGDDSLVRLEYNFDGTGNNGNLTSQRIVRGAFNRLQTFGYDGVNRLWTANESGTGGYNRTYKYDQYGNRWVDPASTHLIAGEPTAQSSFDQYTNRLTGVEYDFAGNQNTSGPFTLGYDAENRNTTITSPNSGNGTYYYDGDGRRVKKVWTPPGGPTQTTYFVYDALGRMAAEYSSDPPATPGRSYMFSDMLGSVRVITDQSGTVQERYDYLPFGRMLSSSDNGRGSVGNYPTDQNPVVPDVQADSRMPQKFTGKERDAETGLDYFGARYYSGPEGRFLSTDPGNIGASTNDPQSWNAYAYGRNNPLKYTDPTGMFYEICPAGGGGCWYGYDSEFASKRTQFEGMGWIFQTSGTICKYDDEGTCRTGGYYNYLGEDSHWKKILYGYKSFMDDVAEGIENCEESPGCGIFMAGLTMAEGKRPSAKTIGAVEKETSKLLEIMHLLPRQFADKFARVGLDIEDFTIVMDKAAHRLKPSGLHTGKGVENWNGAWKEFFKLHPGSASANQILDQLGKMLNKDFMGK